MTHAVEGRSSGNCHGKVRKGRRNKPVDPNFLFGALTIWSQSDGDACGYHDDVSLARGALNWVYPDALHVVGAISTAVAERRLPAIWRDVAIFLQSRA